MLGQKSHIGYALAVILITGSMLVGCGNRERVLEGERLALRASIQVDDEEVVVEKEDALVDRLVLEAPSINVDWTHRNGSAQHKIKHPTLRQSPEKVWTANIGKGNTKKRGITASPIVAGGLIYTMDANAGVRAFTTAGVQVWFVDLTPPNEKANEASGGGMAFGNGVLAVTTGHGEVIALDATNGAVRWRHSIKGAISADPVIVEKTVVAVGRNNIAVGLDIQNGRLKWQQKSQGNTAGVAGAGAPAALGKLVIIPFTSGQLVGTVVTNGLRAWSVSISGRNNGLARNLFADISGDPVIDGRVVYVANQTGRLVAVDRRSGTRLWTAKEGAYTPVWPVGGAVFVVTDRFAVKRLNASDGSEVWSQKLPGFKNKKDRRKRATFAYFGPVVAGGQVWVAGSDGLLRSYNPTTGLLTGTIDIPGGAASQPAIAGGRMYVLSANGQIHAYQ